jgi:parallel beta helix pectate lyase-like protein
MRTNSIRKGSACLSARAGLLLAVASFLLPTAARAANLTVDCSGATPGAFSSITAALNSLPVNSPTEPNIITVTGPCTENVFIIERERLVIQAAPGQTATINAADPSADVLGIGGSRRITLLGLILQGGQTGVIIDRGSEVEIQNSTIQSNSGDGLVVQIGSVLVMENSTIQNNGGNGLSDAAGSSVTLATSPAQRIRILGNAGDGIDIDGSFLQVNFGTLDVENNAGAAIFQLGGRLLVFDGGVGGGNLFQGNGEGIDVFNAGSAQFFGNNTIQGNGDVGLQILGSSVMFNGRVLPDGTVRAAVIQGHAIVGVNVVRLGELTMTGPHRIQNNGTATADPTLRGGIRMIRGSLTLNRGVDISNNTGPGIRADQNTGLSVTNITDSNNSEEGVKVGRQSVAGFFPPLAISGNGIASISCDTTSLVFGDLTGITQINCSQIQRELGPPRPGRVLP